MKKKKGIISLYGNVLLQKAYCEECGDYFFVQDGVLQCCGKPIEEIPERYKREVEPEQKRHRPPKKERDRQLEEQDYRCFYCMRRFGSKVYRKFREVRLEAKWDHMLPYAFSQNNKSTNFVAACQVCNSIKSDRVFNTLEEARITLHTRWIEKGYSDFIEDEEVE